MKKISNAIGLMGITTLLMPLLTFATAACTVDPKGGVGLCTNKFNSVASIINNIIGWVLGFGGALAVLMIIYGGIVYVTSSGNEKRITLAKQILTYAIIGLIVVLLAQVIVVFVGTAITAAQKGN